MSTTTESSVYERYKCVNCKDFLRVPVQLKCACRVCLHCFNILKESGRKQCPNNNEDCLKFVMESNQVVLRDKAHENEMKTITILCPNDKCNKMVCINQLSDHLQECKVEINDSQISNKQVESIANVMSQLGKLEILYDKNQITLMEISNIDNAIKNLRNSVLKLKNSSIFKQTITLEKSVFIWPIHNFVQVYNDAKLNKPPYILSNKFYINDFGYKLIIKLFPNGDGVGSNTHLSMYFALVKGKYDPVLEWPFKEKITLELIGHKNKDYSETFKGTRNSIWAQKPHTKMNIAVGNPKFIAIDRVLHSNEFLINGTLFVKAKIHYY